MAITRVHRSLIHTSLSPAPSTYQRILQRSLRVGSTITYQAQQPQTSESAVLSSEHGENEAATSSSSNSSSTSSLSSSSRSSSNTTNYLSSSIDDMSVLEWEYAQWKARRPELNNVPNDDLLSLQYFLNSRYNNSVSISSSSSSSSSSLNTVIITDTNSTETNNSRLLTTDNNNLNPTQSTILSSKSRNKRLHQSSSSSSSSMALNSSFSPSSSSSLRSSVPSNNDSAFTSSLSASSLSSSSRPLTIEMNAEDKATLSSAMARENMLETEVLTESRLKTLIEREKVLLHRLEGERILASKLHQEWETPLATKIDAEQRACEERAGGRSRVMYAPYLLQADALDLAKITIRETLSYAINTSLSSRLVAVVVGIGTAIERHVADSIAISPTSPLGNRNLLTSSGKYKGKKKSTGKGGDFTASKKHNANDEQADMGWPTTVRASLGGVLLQMLLETAYVRVDIATGKLLDEAELEKAFHNDGTEEGKAFNFGPPMNPMPLVQLTTGGHTSLNVNTNPALVQLAHQAEQKADQLSNTSSPTVMVQQPLIKINSKVPRTTEMLVAPMQPTTDEAVAQARAIEPLTRSTFARMEPSIVGKRKATNSVKGMETFLDSRMEVESGTIRSLENNNRNNHESNHTTGTAAGTKPVKVSLIKGVTSIDEEKELLASAAAMVGGPIDRTDPRLEGIRVKVWEAKQAKLKNHLRLMYHQSNGTSPSEPTTGSTESTIASVTTDTDMNTDNMEIVVEGDNEYFAKTETDPSTPELSSASSIESSASTRTVDNSSVSSAVPAVGTFTKPSLSNLDSILLLKLQYAQLRRLRGESSILDSTMLDIDGIETVNTEAINKSNRMKKTQLQRLAEKAASRVKISHITTPQGQQVAVVPAFMVDYVWERDVGPMGSWNNSSAGGGGGMNTNDSPTVDLVVGSSSSGGGGGEKSLSSTRKYGGIKYTSFLFANPRLAEVLTARSVQTALQAPRPMVVPPRPWKDFDDTPYLRIKTTMVRTDSTHQKVLRDVLREEKRLIETSTSNNLRPTDSSGAPVPLFHDIVDTLNILSSVPWRINRFVLDQVKKLWIDDGASKVPGMPSVPGMPPYRDEAASYPAPYKQHMIKEGLMEIKENGTIDWRNDADTNAQKTAHSRWIRQVRRGLSTDMNSMSLRASFNLAFHRALCHEEDTALYFPHNMDFRGRVYPIPPHFNHMGSDFARGILTYAKGVALGTEGETWLKVHLANLLGKDKLSFRDRIDYVEANLPAIIAAGKDPLGTGGDLWVHSESPFQALAVCKEFYELSKLSVHTRMVYESRIPVHQDGSCNGLQHYAALGRDEDGAKAVNLVYNEIEDKPADVYTQVLHLVLAKIEADINLPVEALRPDPRRVERVREDTSVFARRESEFAWIPGAAKMEITPSLDDTMDNSSSSSSTSGLQQVDVELHTRRLRKMCALFLKGHVDRKVVKQTVMTSVYGVTFIGARDQVWNRLHEKLGSVDLSAQGLSADERDYLLQASAQYLARATLTSLGDLFSRARQIMGWLGDTATAITSRGQPVAWTTPLGMPIVQPYYNDMTTAVILGGNSNLSGPLSGMRVEVASASRTGKVMKSRQRTAFPPNFIHALDSSHMFMTAAACSRAGITFSAVHDSYWCHAAHVGTMRDILRDRFINLYSRPILEDFVSSLHARFPGLLLPELPTRGNLDLMEIRKSKYFFS